MTPESVRLGDLSLACFPCFELLLQLCPTALCLLLCLQYLVGVNADCCTLHQGAKWGSDLTRDRKLSSDCLLLLLWHVT